MTVINSLRGPQNMFVLTKVVLPNCVLCNSPASSVGGGRGVQKTSSRCSRHRACSGKVGVASQQHCSSQNNLLLPPLYELVENTAGWYLFCSVIDFHSKAEAYVAWGTMFAMAMHDFSSSLAGNNYVPTRVLQMDSVPLYQTL